VGRKREKEIDLELAIQEGPRGINPL